MFPSTTQAAINTQPASVVEVRSDKAASSTSASVPVMNGASSPAATIARTLSRIGAMRGGIQTGMRNLTTVNAPAQQFDGTGPVNVTVPESNRMSPVRSMTDAWGNAVTIRPQRQLSQRYGASATGLEPNIKLALLAALSRLYSAGMR